MAVLYRNAILLLNGVELTGMLHEFTVDYSVEILDVTTFGADTRIKRGGLFTGKISGKGFFDGTYGIESIIFAEMGSSALTTPLINPAYLNGTIVEDTLVVAFPDGVVEGGTTLGMGYALKAAVADMKVGGAVGVVLDVDFSAESRGLAGISS